MLASFFTWLDSLEKGSASFVGAAIAFFFGLIALLAGALFNYSLNRRRDNRLRRDEADAIAAALYGEILLLRKEVARAGEITARMELESSPRKKFDRYFVDENPISDPAIYRALAQKLGVLPSADVLAITEFYAHVAAVRWWMPRLVEDKERTYGYDVRYVLEPVRDAVQKIEATLRSIERRLHISNPADPLAIKYVVSLISAKEEEWEVIREQNENTIVLQHKG